MAGGRPGEGEDLASRPRGGRGAVGGIASGGVGPSRPWNLGAWMDGSRPEDGAAKAGLLPGLGSSVSSKISDAERQDLPEGGRRKQHASAGDYCKLGDKLANKYNLGHRQYSTGHSCSRHSRRAPILAIT